MMKSVFILVLGLALIQTSLPAPVKDEYDEEGAKKLGNRFIKVINKAFSQFMTNFVDTIRDDESGEVPPDLERAALVIAQAAEDGNIDYSQAIGRIFQLPFLAREDQFRTFLSFLRPAAPANTVQATVINGTLVPAAGGAGAAAANDPFSQAIQAVMGMFSNPQFGNIMSQMFQNLPSMFSTIREFFEGIFSGDS